MDMGRRIRDTLAKMFTPNMATDNWERSQTYKQEKKK